MAAGGMAEHHHALPVPAPQKQAGARICSIMSAMLDLRAQIVAGDRDRDAIGVGRAKWLKLDGAASASSRRG